MAPTGLLESFVAAIQASLSVLLVIFYGGVAAKLKIIDAKSTKAISKICVRMFLPALLIVKIGSQLEAGKADRYGIILLWALIVHLISFLLGIFAHLVLGMPDWTTVALMFNNSTSYPLLLLGALGETGILGSLTQGDETPDEATERAKTYFLVYATVSSCLTFAVGPRLIDSELAPEEKEDGNQANGTNGSQNDGVDEEADEHSALLDGVHSVRFASPFPSRSSFLFSKRKASENPKPQIQDRRASVVPKKHWKRLSPRTRWWLLFISDFFNAPLLGAVIGAVIGLVPSLHKAFFADSTDGGIFTAWLTASLKNTGNLFVTLPIVVAGVSLYTSYQESRQHPQPQGSGLPKLTVAFILLIRFIIWPAVSIGVIYALASRTSALGTDPMLWFTMMMMPSGPPAMKLIALVQVSDAEEGEEASIAKVLTISYLVSPILSFTVVGSLLASQACI
ncbi:auxin efflux carrier [Xylariales sp. AK1849]|nr:auxin efflux carrier [Xylariales sp. AK1849]